MPDHAGRTALGQMSAPAGPARFTLWPAELGAFGRVFGALRAVSNHSLRHLLLGGATGQLAPHAAALPMADVHGHGQLRVLCRVEHELRLPAGRVDPR